MMAENSAPLVCKHEKHLVDWNKHPKYYSKLEATGYAGRCACGKRVFDYGDEQELRAVEFPT